MQAYNLIAVCILILLSCKELTPSMMSVTDSSTEQTFLYFAYGSNLLAKRIHVNNPTAQFLSIAKLPHFWVKNKSALNEGLEEKLVKLRWLIRNHLSNFRLDFDADRTFDKNIWNGAYATIVDDTSSVVWGALWILKAKDIANLDRQEGVNSGTYKVRNVLVYTPKGQTLMARTYQMTEDPPKVPPKCLPLERQPSDTYMNVILYGAFECSLPMHYIRFLFTFPTNGQLGTLKAVKLLGYPFNSPEMN